MLRRFPTKPSGKQSLLLFSLRDYFGETNAEEKQSIRRLSLWMINLRKGIVLTLEESEIKERVKMNMLDKVYTEGLV